MSDESVNISSRTFQRTVDPIHKVGYSDGTSDGQAAIYQTSFDTGYEQGFNFGFYLGIMDAKTQAEQSEEKRLRDPRRINCQICQNSDFLEENIVNLYNIQKEKNDEYIKYNK